MVLKKLITIFSIVFLLIGTVSVGFASNQEDEFSFFGVNFSKLWDFISFWKRDNIQENKDVNTNVVSNVKRVNSNTSIVRKEVTYSLTGVKYTKKDLQNKINNNEELKGYIQGFNYDCLGIKTDMNEQFTMYFDVEKGTLLNVKKNIDCSKEIFMEESLLLDIKKEGFQATSIKSYLERVDLPTTMYFKAVKVFTIG